MANFNPRFEAEPYEQSQGDSPKSTASPDDLKAFYQDMERKEVVERKLSKRKSGPGTSIWSRKSVKRSVNPTSTQEARPQQELAPLETRHEATMGDGEEKEKPDEQKEKPDQLSTIGTRSIIPDSLRELPAWYNKDDWAAAPHPSHRMKFPLHNPVGPRWYKNHHLIPLSQLRTATRPPSVFSPSFPPMSLSMHERSEDSMRMPGPSRTPSGSPVPTPNSSQVRVEDANGGRRSRKNSQTPHDTVDLLDVTDPWGTNWHHQSPYDVGLGNGPSSGDIHDGPNKSRSRLSSMTTGRRRMVTPSPLSQSTSAVHLQTLDGGTHIPRKLSKRRTPVLGNLFGGSSKEPERNAVSLPTTPIDHPPTPTAPQLHDPPVHGPQVNGDLPKRMSTLPAPGPSSIHQDSSSKKGKRGSVLGRLARRFSILKKPQEPEKRTSVREEDWHHVGPDDAKSDGDTRRSAMLGRRSSPEKPHMEARKSTDPIKRVPPPSLEPEVSGARDGRASKHDASHQGGDRSSFISLEAPFSIGRLTIANPDSPSSENNTPLQRDIPLPPEKLEQAPETQRRTGEQQPHMTEAPAPVQSPAVPSAPSPASPQPASPSYHSAPAAPSFVSANIPRTPSSETHSPMRPAEKPQPPPPTPSPAPPPAPAKPKATAPAAVPFPAVDAPLPQIPPFIPSPVSFMSIDDSPLSAASMLVNPPTPYTDDVPMPSSSPTPPIIQTHTSLEGRRSSREPLPSGQVSTVTGRQTETFKLIRSASGHIYASGETITAAGEQWEVVESTRSNGKDKSSMSKARDRDSGSRRDQRKQEKSKADTDADPERRRVRTQSKQQSNEPPAASSRSSRTPRSTSVLVRQRPAIPDTMLSRQEESKSTRRRDDDRDRKTDRKQPSPATLNVNKPQPARPPPTPAASAPRPLERQPSTSARPTSELPSSAEMNALRAREAWEMERLWKARSMYGTEPNGHVSTAAPIRSSTGTFSSAKNVVDASVHGAGHGSSHTSFMVQTPFQGQPSHIYHSMPVVPPPIIYSSAPSVPHSLHHSSSAHSYPTSQRSFRNSFSSPDPPPTTSTSRPPLANPLPAPPRESTFTPSTVLDSSSGRSTEYWTKYAGVTTAH